MSRREESRSTEVDPIAVDVDDTYRESDVPDAVARDRARDAERNAERSGQADEPTTEVEKGTATLDQ